MCTVRRPEVAQVRVAFVLLAAACLLIPCSGCVPAAGEDVKYASTTGAPPDYYAPSASTTASSVEPPERISTEQPRRRGDGRKYRKLLRKIEAKGDEESYGEFNDWGYWSGTSYRGHADLPPGYWVYVTPYWYIFGETGETTPQARPPRPESPPVAKRSWGPEQATGKPDTHEAGDLVTAWASETADGQDEWLSLRYRRAVTPTAVHVYETYNPGALYRITAKDPSGREIEIWSGEDPVAVGSGMGKAAVPVKADFRTDCITIYLKSSGVRGWNEIDAVGLLDADENVQWAVSATASSSYADRTAAPPPPTPQSNQRRIEKLEAEVRSLRAELNSGKIILE